MCIYQKLLIFMLVVYSFVIFVASFAFGENNIISCEEKILINIEKGVEEIVFNNKGVSVFKHPGFETIFFSLEVKNDKIRLSSGEWISLKEGGESCYTWGVIGPYTICIGIKRDQIGIFDKGTFLNPGKWAYTSLFEEGEARSKGLKLRIITDGKKGYISINNSKPLKLWELITTDEFSLKEKNTCPRLNNCKIKNEWICNKDGINCVQTVKNFEPLKIQNIGSCYTTFSNHSRKVYNLCDTNGIITAKEIGTEQEKKIGEGFFFRKKEIICK